VSCSKIESVPFQIVPIFFGRVSLTLCVDFYFFNVSIPLPGIFILPARIDRSTRGWIDIQEIFAQTLIFWNWDYMNASVPLNDIVLAIERDVNSNKHKKDPFLPQYVDLTTSEYQQKENDSNFDTLSRNLKVRTSLITAQLSTLCKELDSVGSEAKGPGDRAPATKPTKDATACATIHTGEE